jgi:Beta-lactamase class C and other penicillin binding proteins
MREYSLYRIHCARFKINVMEVEMRDLNALLETVRAEAQLPALAAALIEKNRLVALGAAGRRRADKDDQVQRDDRFHIGSCTKSMTATLVARLVEMGKLDWSSTVAEVLSDIRKSIRREYWKVTVEQLLTHRSGMPQNLSAHRQLFSRLWNRSATQRLQAVRIILQEKPVASTRGEDHLLD